MESFKSNELASDVGNTTTYSHYKLQPVLQYAYIAMFYYFQR